MWKNKLFVLIITAILALPSIAVVDESDIISLDPADGQEMGEILPEENPVLPQHEEIAVPQESIENPLLPHKTPVSKKKIIKKFLFAMVGVGISSFLIFGILSAYNKLREGFASISAQNLPPVEGEEPLEAPDSIDNAIKTFLDKTDWK